MVPDNKDFVICMYCGVNVKVREAILILDDKNQVNWLFMAEKALKAKNYEEAYEYYNKIIESDNSSVTGWSGKAECTGYLFDGENSRLPEIITYFENAIEYSNNDVNVIQAISSKMTFLAARIFEISYDNYNRGRHAEKIPGNHLGITYDVINALEWAIDKNPGITTAEWICYAASTCLIYDTTNSIHYRYLINGAVEFNNWKEYKSWVSKKYYWYAEKIESVDPENSALMYKKRAKFIKNRDLIILLVVISFLFMLFILTGK